MIHKVTTNPSYAEISKRPAPIPHFNPAGNKLAVFIGKDSARLSGLMLESGYAGVAAEHPGNSQNLLIRLLYSHGLLPDVIICDGSFRDAELRKLMDFIIGMTEFRYIPFLICSENSNPLVKERIRRTHGVDDIISPRAKIDDICAKVDFLKKFKSLKANIGNPQSESRHRPVLSANFIIKRIFDILIASLLVVVFSPLMVLIALLIKLESKGPVFYKALRAGSSYRVFRFIKFRTMEVGADSKLNDLTHLNQYNTGGAQNQPVFFKVSNDPRITRIGALLRNSSLDELPQLFNVIMGDMSIVGNRPLPLYEAATLTTDQWAERFLAPAGITGLWQIRKRGQKDMSVHERINLDIDYAQKHSFLYDMWIMAHTPSALIQTENV